MREIKIVCDGCDKEIIPYSPDPRSFYYEVNPIQFRSGGFVYDVYLTPQEQEIFCSECWYKMRSTIKPRIKFREERVTDTAPPKPPDNDIDYM